MSKKADLSVSLFFPDGTPFTSFDNSNYEIKIAGNVVVVKTKEIIEEYHGFVFVVRKTKETNEE